MVERIKFDGLDRDLIVDFGDPHSSHEAAVYMFDQHLPMLTLSSDEGHSYYEVYSMVGEHRQTCEDNQPDIKRT